MKKFTMICLFILSINKLLAQPESCMNIGVSPMTISVSNNTPCDIVIITERFFECEGAQSIGTGFSTTIGAGQLDVVIPYWDYVPSPLSECQCSIKTYVTIYFANDPGQTYSYIWNPRTLTMWAASPLPMIFNNVCNGNYTLHFIQDITGTTKGIFN